MLARLLARYLLLNLGCQRLYGGSLAQFRDLLVVGALANSQAFAYQLLQLQKLRNLPFRE